MKRERHKIRELRRLVELCGGELVLGNMDLVNVYADASAHQLQGHADHIICHVRAVLWDELVAIHRCPDGFGWVQYAGNGKGIGCSMVNYPTEPAAMIVLLEEING